MAMPPARAAGARVLRAARGARERPLRPGSDDGANAAVSGRAAASRMEDLVIIAADRSQDVTIRTFRVALAALLAVISELSNFGRSCKRQRRMPFCKSERILQGLAKQKGTVGVSEHREDQDLSFWYRAFVTECYCAATRRARAGKAVQRTQGIPRFPQLHTLTSAAHRLRACGNVQAGGGSALAVSIGGSAGTTVRGTALRGDPPGGRRGLANSPG